MNRTPPRLEPTIFDVMSGLARRHGAINLGQGFPETEGPLELRQAAAAALIEGSNQYPPMRGLPETRAAVAEHYARLQGVDLDWESEVTITSGATEALAAALLAVIGPGDEVVLFEPLYDSYLPMIRRAGGTPRLVRLEPPHWRIPADALAAAIGPNTRAIVVNTPLNPAGAMLAPEDLALIAQTCAAHDLIAVSDEVWEHVVFDGRKHLSLLALPGMRERTIKIGSAGKMFSMTGWKVGFACAAPPLTDALVSLHQYLTFTTPPNLQAAAAIGLAQPASALAAMSAAFQNSRDRLSHALTAEGFAVLPSQGTYFLGVDLRASGVALPDRDFALRAVAQFGVAAIPYSAFYAADAPPTHLLRLCFAKTPQALDQGAERLAAARRALS